MDTLTTAVATQLIPTTWDGGKCTCVAQGTFGSGTFKAEASFDGSNWITLKDSAGDDLALTAEGIFTFEIAKCQLRGVLTGSTGATVEFAFRPFP